MSLRFQLEPVEVVWNELLVLAHQHWMGTQSYRRHEPFNPSFARYQACNQSGFFQLFTARDGDILAGYFGVYITDSMHSQKKMATEDTFFLAQAYRGGRNAIRFLDVIERQCQAWGVEEILFSCEQDNATGIQGLLLRLDYRPVIVQYSKRLTPSPHGDTVQSDSKEALHVCTEPSPCT